MKCVWQSLQMNRTVAIGELVLDRSDNGAHVPRLLITDMLVQCQR
jgi:hypothetical protein